MIEILALWLAFQLGGSQSSALKEISASESFDRAPSSISASYSFQCGDHSATIVINVAQARTPSGAKVLGRSTAVAFLDGVPLGAARDTQLTEVMNAVSILPQVMPNFSDGRPQVYFSWQDRSEVWQFIEDGQ